MTAGKMDEFKFKYVYTVENKNVEGNSPIKCP
jgi:hypothetical protein